MPLSRSRDYLSIGEVLDAVSPDFPDVSISKIRFLETEGLITPERTPSGYRKFYESDVERLRYVLSLQKEHFLPLKVIKERLQNGNGDLQPAAPVAGAPAPEPRPQPEEQLGTGVQLSREELLRVAGLAPAEAASLEDFGLLRASDEGYFDENDLVLAKAFAGFLRFGIEARHLKMYKQFAEREAALLEQMVAPLTRKKSGDGAGEAASAVKELAGLSKKVRDALQRTTLRELF